MSVTTVPRHVPSTAADLLRLMLVVDPDRRITLKEVARHPCVSLKIPAVPTQLQEADLADETDTNSDIIQDVGLLLGLDDDSLKVELQSSSSSAAKMKKLVRASHGSERPAWCSRVHNVFVRLDV